MRVANPPHTAVITARDTTAAHPRDAHPRALLMPVVAALLATAALLIVWRPAVVHAQGSSPTATEGAPSAAATTSAATTSAAETSPAAQDSTRRTHVVKAGETLWSLAVRYYGDGHQWPELARRNGISPSSRKPLLVGVRLTVPSEVPARTANAARTKPGADVPAVATTPASPPAAPKPADSTARGGRSLAAQTAGRGNAGTGSAARSTNRPAPKTPAVAGAAAADSARANQERLRPLVKSETPIDRGGVRVGLVEPGSAAGARGREDATIFLRRLPSAEETRAMIDAAKPIAEARPRHAEYAAAPFVADQLDVDRGGLIVRRVGTSSAPVAGQAERMLLEDEVEITAAAGNTLRVGDELISVTDGGALRREKAGTRVVVPTGVLRVVRADAGQPVVAVVRSQSGLVTAGQRLLPLSGSAASPATPAPSDRGDIAGTVLWVENDALLPTLQTFVILSAGATQGAKAGDQFALVRPRGSPNATDEERIAVVRIVRAGASESTGIVVKQDLGAIATGVTVRRIARAP